MNHLKVKQHPSCLFQDPLDAVLIPDKPQWNSPLLHSSAVWNESPQHSIPALEIQKITSYWKYIPTKLSPLLFVCSSQMRNKGVRLRGSGLGGVSAVGRRVCKSTRPRRTWGGEGGGKQKWIEGADQEGNRSQGRWKWPSGIVNATLLNKPTPPQDSDPSALVERGCRGSCGKSESEGNAGGSEVIQGGHDLVTRPKPRSQSLLPRAHSHRHCYPRISSLSADLWEVIEMAANWLPCEFDIWAGTEDWRGRDCEEQVASDIEGVWMSGLSDAPQDYCSILNMCSRSKWSSTK